MPAGHRLRPLLLGALTALTVATPLLPSESAASHGTGAVLIMLWFVLLLGWLAVGVWEGRLTVRTGPTVWALLAFAVWYSLSAAVMARDGQPRASCNYLWLWLSLILGGILARQLLRTALECRAIVAVMIALAVGLSVHGYYQYFWSMPATRAAFQRNPDKVLAEAGVQRAPRLSPKETVRGSAAKHRADRHVHAGQLARRFSLRLVGCDGRRGDCGNPRIKHVPSPLAERHSARPLSPAR